MAPRSVKHNVGQMMARSFEGIEASSYVNGLEARVPYPGGAVVPYVSSVDFNKPWFDHRNGDHYCLLCSAWATEGHVMSDKHKTRATNPEWYMASESAVPAPQYDKPWFEDRGGQWYCLLCSQWATEGHLGAEKHRKREAAPQYYGYGFGTVDGAGAGLPSAPSSSSALALYKPAVIPAEYNFPWIEPKGGDYYCNLCSAWATEGHLGSEKHKKRAAAPEWYGWDQPAVSSAATPLPALTQRAHSEAPAVPSLPPGWRAYWSEEHSRWYFHHELTNSTHWDMPAEAQATSSIGQPAVASRAHAAAGMPQAQRPAMAAQPAVAVAAPAATPSAPSANLPQPWMQYWSQEEQRYYYHNPETQTTQWEEPLAGAPSAGLPHGVGLEV